MGLRNWLRSFTAAGSKTLRSWIGRWMPAEQPGSLAPPSGFGAAPVGLQAMQEARESILEAPDRPGSETPTPTDWLGMETSTGRPPPLSGEDQAVWGREWHQMASTNVDEIRYLPEDRVLEVIFHNNYHYLYYNVPKQVFLDFLTAPSPGRYVWGVLRADGYEYARVASGAIPIFPTGNVTRTANVVRPLLPEELEALAPRLAELRPGEAFKKPKIPLRQADWRLENVYATPAQMRERRAQRRGRRTV